MRHVLWMVALGGCLVLLVGVAALVEAAPVAAQERAAVTVVDNAYDDGDSEPTVTHIEAGDTVEWRWSPDNENRHTVTSAEMDEDFDSDPRCGGPADRCGQERLEDPSKPFTHTFDEPGRYEYFCKTHLAGHRGTIVVEAAPSASSSQSQSPSQSDSSSESPSPSDSESGEQTALPTTPGEEPSSPSGSQSGSPSPSTSDTGSRSGSPSSSESPSQQSGTRSVGPSPSPNPSPSPSPAPPPVTRGGSGSITVQESLREDGFGAGSAPSVDTLDSSQPGTVTSPSFSPFPSPGATAEPDADGTSGEDDELAVSVPVGGGSLPPALVGLAIGSVTVSSGALIKFVLFGPSW